MRSLGYVSQIGRHWTHGTFPNKPQRCFSTLVIQAKGVTRLWPEVRHHVGIDPTWCRPPAEFHSLTYDVGRVFVDESDSLPASHHHLRGGRLLQGTVEALATQPICSIRDVVDDRRRPLRPGDAHGSLDNHLRLARTGISHLIYRRCSSGWGSSSPRHRLLVAFEADRGSPRSGTHHLHRNCFDVRGDDTDPRRTS